MVGKVFVLALALAAASPLSARATPRVAVFDIELKDTSLQGETDGALEAESARLQLLTDRLREALADSGLYEVVDIAPVREQALGSNLQACGGCDWRMAESLGADLSVTGIVQKVSNLILNISLYVRDAKTGQTLANYSVDIRSNTDESWLRGLNWILKNRLLTEKTPQ